MGAMSDSGQDSYARGVIIEKTVEAVVGVLWTRANAWLAERDRHASGETRRACFRRWGKALDDTTDDEEETDGD